jgi:hypothetical protein
MEDRRPIAWLGDRGDRQHDEFTQKHKERGTTRRGAEHDTFLGGDGQHMREDHRTDQNLGVCRHLGAIYEPTDMTPRMAENELQRSTNNIVKWASEAGFTISAERTKTLLVY